MKQSGKRHGAKLSEQNFMDPKFAVKNLKISKNKKFLRQKWK